MITERLVHAVRGCRSFTTTLPYLRCTVCSRTWFLPVGYRADDPRLPQREGR